MSQARCNARRRRQAKNKFAHMSGDRRRPKYKARQLMDLGAAIAAERRAAARAAQAKKKS